MKENVLVVDDVEELAKAVKTILEYNDYNVEMVFNGMQALEKLKQFVYDIIILDVMMPVMDGIETVKEIRKLNIKTPIILLTAKSQVEDKVEGLDAGANDYLTKPFNKDELLARIRALTRVNEENKERYTVGNLIFDKEQSEISTNKASLHLNNKECEVMEYLVKNQERTVSKEELRQRVWINEKNNENIDIMYISYLQEKFSALGANIKINDVNGYSLENL